MSVNVNALNLAAEIDSIYSHIQETSIDSDPDQVKDELDTCSSYLARSAQMVADAEYLLNVAKGKAAEDYVRSLGEGEKFNATQSNNFVNARTAIESRLYKLAERLNRTLTHRIDALRSVLSFEKSLRERSPS